MVFMFFFILKIIHDSIFILCPEKTLFELYVLVHTTNSSTQEAGEGVVREFKASLDCKADLTTS